MLGILYMRPMLKEERPDASKPLFREEANDILDTPTISGLGLISPSQHWFRIAFQCSIKDAPPSLVAEAKRKVGRP